MRTASAKKLGNRYCAYEVDVEHAFILVIHYCVLLDPNELIPFCLTFLVQQGLGDPSQEVARIESFLRITNKVETVSSICSETR